MAKIDITKQTEDLLSVVKTLNGLAVANVERLIDLQIDGLRKYSDVALASWKDALAVKDIESGQAYFAKQGQVAQDVVKNLAEDAKVVAEIGNEYANEVQKVVADSVATVTKKAA